MSLQTRQECVSMHVCMHADGHECMHACVCKMCKRGVGGRDRHSDGEADAKTCTHLEKREREKMEDSLTVSPSP